MREYLRIQGGLGNQMFQYSYAYVLGKYYSSAEIICDVRGFEKYTRRRFELASFDLPILPILITDGKLKYDIIIKLYHLYQAFYFKLTKKRPSKLSKSLCKKGYILCGRFCGLPMVDLPEEIYLYGYFSNEEVIRPYRNELCEVFSVRHLVGNALAYKNRIKRDSISVSIRCGEDYKKDGWPICSKEYYQRAVDMLNPDRNRQLVVFADDIDRIKKEKWFGDYNPLFIENISPNCQIELMKACQDYVIANSSFSWWGAYLGASMKESRIVAPVEWYVHTNTKDTKLVFDNMTILE